MRYKHNYRRLFESIAPYKKDDPNYSDFVDGLINDAHIDIVKSNVNIIKVPADVIFKVAHDTNARQRLLSLKSFMYFAGYSKKRAGFIKILDMVMNSKSILVYAIDNAKKPEAVIYTKNSMNAILNPIISDGNFYALVIGKKALKIVRRILSGSIKI